MGVVQRQSIKGTIAVLIGAAIQYFILLFLMPHFFTINEVGLFRNYHSLILLFSIIGSFGVGNAIVFNLHKYEGENAKQKPLYNFTTLMITLLLSVLTFSFLFVLKEIIYHYKSNSPQFLSFFWCIPSSAAFLIFLYYFESYSIATQRITFSNLIKEVGVRIILLAIVVLYGYKYISLTQFYTFYTASFAIGAIALFGYVYFIRHYRIQPNTTWIKSADARSQFKFSIHISINIIVGIILSTLEPIIYNISGAKSTAIYGTAVTLSAFMFLPYKTLAQIVSPTLKEAWMNNDIQKINSINRSTANNLSFIGMLFFIVLLANFNNILCKIDPQYLQAKTAFIIICMARALDFATGTNSEIIFASPSYRKATLFILLCLPVYFGLAYTLIPKFDVTGAALVLAGVLLFQNSLKLIFLYRTYKIVSFSPNSIVIILVFVGIYFLQQFLPPVSNWMLDTLIRSAVITVAATAIVYGLKLVPELNQNLNKIKSFLR